MRRDAVTVVCLAAAVTLAGCSEATRGLPAEPGTGPQSTTFVAPAKTADPPMGFDTAAAVALPKSALRANLAGDAVSRFLTLRERTAYIVAPNSLTAVDVLTSKQNWTVGIEGKPADPYAQSGPFVNPVGPRPPAVTDKLAAAAVATAEPGQGTTPGFTALTVVAADATSGAKAWQAKVKVATDTYGGSGQGSVTKVSAISDKAVVASYSDSDRAFTVALDAATGATLWERRDYEAGSLNGHVLVGTDSNVAENKSMNQATALDVVTGGQLWVGATRASQLTVVPSDPALVVVNRTDYGSGKPSLLFLDPASGAVKGELKGEGGFGSRAYGECVYDQQSVLVCTNGGRVTGYNAKTAEQLWTLPDVGANRVAPGVVTAWHGAVYGRVSGKPIVLDAKTGKDISATVEVAPFWVSRYAGIGVDKDGAPQAYPVK
ncbi:PQQ-like beta-propeller repeat protein [Allokutzneria sp. A3M-2-11 16]|uniref:outer membrane protein assembly factor BamB family protein n=1 Tax=Allokutzneria sp. A3M-2-11 16 TaxID=2962043 RepID=UPI0020B678AA|nr:PQQ-binding-like beta-propeller repeat protein [Allokutzneria sp. A3M-2-11 16]MCP3801298.1 PQQ-like beta-propeller repeat protein [Allokutzneria sp. A3M-2-11 16]